MLGSWDVEMLRSWEVGILVKCLVRWTFCGCNVVMLGSWDVVILGCWVVGMLGCWDVGMLVKCLVRWTFSRVEVQVDIFAGATGLPGMT